MTAHQHTSHHVAAVPSYGVSSNVAQKTEGYTTAGMTAPGVQMSSLYPVAGMSPVAVPQPSAPGAPGFEEAPPSYDSTMQADAPPAYSSVMYDSNEGYGKTSY